MQIVVYDIHDKHLARSDARGMMMVVETAVKINLFEKAATKLIRSY